MARSESQYLARLIWKLFLKDRITIQKLYKVKLNLLQYRITIQKLYMVRHNLLQDRIKIQRLYARSSYSFSRIGYNYRDFTGKN